MKIYQGKKTFMFKSMNKDTLFLQELLESLGYVEILTLDKK